MKPIGWGLALALFAAVMAPVAVISAPKQEAAIPDAARKQGMAEAPAAVQSAKLSCQLKDARFIGEAADPKTKAKSKFYEVACDNGMGYVIQAPASGAPLALSCLQTPKGSSVQCILPANSDPKAALAPTLSKAGVQCTPTDARFIGASETNSVLEVACQGGAGYVLIGSYPFDPTKPAQAQNCLNFDEQQGNVKCTLTDRATRLAAVDQYAKAANNGCVVADKRFIGSAQSGSDFYEAKCQDGKGFVYEVKGGVLKQTIGCAQAQGILGGCTLVDVRQAQNQQATLYTKMAHDSGSTCDVDKYANFPNRGNEEVVEMACKSGQGAIGFFPASGKGKVLDCGHALAEGYKCTLSKDNGYAALTADLKKFNYKTCQVSNARPVGKTAKGTVFVEVACADGYKGYMIEYNMSPTVSAVGAQGCAFAGGCKLPGNT